MPGRVLFVLALGSQGHLELLDYKDKIMVPEEIRLCKLAIKEDIECYRNWLDKKDDVPSYLYDGVELKKLMKDHSHPGTELAFVLQNDKSASDWIDKKKWTFYRDWKCSALFGSNCSSNAECFNIELPILEYHSSVARNLTTVDRIRENVKQLYDLKESMKNLGGATMPDDLIMKWKFHLRHLEYTSEVEKWNQTQRYEAVKFLEKLNSRAAILMDHLLRCECRENEIQLSIYKDFMSMYGKWSNQNATEKQWEPCKEFDAQIRFALGISVFMLLFGLVCIVFEVISILVAYKSWKLSSQMPQTIDENPEPKVMVQPGATTNKYYQPSDPALIKPEPSGEASNHELK